MMSSCFLTIRWSSHCSLVNIIGFQVIKGKPTGGKITPPPRMVKGMRLHLSHVTVFIGLILEFSQQNYRLKNLLSKVEKVLAFCLSFSNQGKVILFTYHFKTLHDN